MLTTHEEGKMRSLMDNYVYANPYVEPISLDALAFPDGEDGEFPYSVGHLKVE